MMQTDNPILIRRPDLRLINKKKITCYLVDLVILADHRVKRERKGKQILGSCYSNYVIQLYTFKMYRRLKIYKIIGKDKSANF